MDKVQLYQNSNEFVTDSNSGNMISVFRDELLNKQVFTAQLARLKKAFPKLHKEWYEELRERLKAKNFTNQRLISAVDNLIDTYDSRYNEPRIANILDFDMKIEVVDPVEVYKKVHEMRETFYDLYMLVELNGTRKWVKKDDAAKFNLKPVKVEEKYRVILKEDNDEDLPESSLSIRQIAEKLSVKGILTVKNNEERKPIDYEDAKKNFAEELKREGINFDEKRFCYQR